jgi:hypothetical protein
MGHFFSDDVLTHMRKTNPQSLEAIVSEFPIKLKRAMYAAAERGNLKTGTWVNCGFNAAGKVIGVSNINSNSKAAAVFNISDTLVSRFITKWDGFRMDSSHLSDLLKSALLTVGIETPPDALKEQRKTGVIIYTDTVYKSAQTKFLEELEQADTPADLGITNAEFAAAADFVHDLVST